MLQRFIRKQKNKILIFVKLLKVFKKGSKSPKFIEGKVFSVERRKIFYKASPFTYTADDAFVLREALMNVS